MSDWVIRLIQQSGYLGVGFLMFLETVFPPIPSEVIMPVAGMAAAEGKMSFPLVVPAGLRARCSETSSGTSLRGR
jgi:membrane protein DedA with SNARE-associated domain